MRLCWQMPAPHLLLLQFSRLPLLLRIVGLLPRRVVVILLTSSSTRTCSAASASRAHTCPALPLLHFWPLPRQLPRPLCHPHHAAIIRASMEAGLHVRVKQGCAAAAVQHRTPASRRHHVFRHHVFRRRSLQSLRLFLMRRWAHMPSPPQWRLSRSCSQMPAPLQSLQVLLSRLCLLMLALPQSLHLCLMRLCSQMLVPPQSLHLLLSWLCAPSAVRSPAASAPPVPDDTKNGRPAVPQCCRQPSPRGTRGTYPAASRGLTFPTCATGPTPAPRRHPHRERAPPPGPRSPSAPPPSQAVGACIILVIL